MERWWWGDVPHRESPDFASDRWSILMQRTRDRVDEEVFTWIDSHRTAGSREASTVREQRIKKPGSCVLRETDGPDKSCLYKATCISLSVQTVESQGERNEKRPAYSPGRGRRLRKGVGQGRGVQTEEESMQMTGLIWSSKDSSLGSPVRYCSLTCLYDVFMRQNIAQSLGSIFFYLEEGLGDTRRRSVSSSREVWREIWTDVSKRRKAGDPPTVCICS